MASPISHIIYCKRYFETLESDEGVSKLRDQGTKIVPLAQIDKDEFILGASFPDIRFIDDRIKRKDTHMSFPKIDLDFSDLTSFQAGWKFHLYCDMKREEILNNYKFYSLPDASDAYGRPAKLLEDSLVYDYYDNWEKISLYFSHAPFIETGVKIDQETLSLWYAILAKYVEKKPDDKSYQTIISKLSGLAPRTEEYLKKIKELRKNKKITEILIKIKDEIV